MIRKDHLILDLFLCALISPLLLVFAVCYLFDGGKIGRRS